jgi:glycosyltransferase involved in cell wall biosynthesis
MSLLVIIPVYNKVATLQRAVQSVLNQEYKKFEILIVDDGSTDGSSQLANELAEDKVKVLSQRNKGAAAARNAGIQHAIDEKYERIAFLDADDYWSPNHLTTLFTLTEKFPDASVFAANYQLIRKRRVYKTKFSNIKLQESQQLDPFFKFNYLNPILNCSSFMMDVSLIDKVGHFKEELSHFEDIDFFIRLGMHGTIVISSQVTVSIDETAMNRSDKTDMSQRLFPDFTDYDEQVDTYDGLGKYLTLNRYAIALAYRMENDILNANKFQNLIQVEHLNKKQQKLLNMSRLQLKSLKKTQRVLGNLGFHLRAGE